MTKLTSGAADGATRAADGSFVRAARAGSVGVTSEGVPRWAVGLSFTETSTGIGTAHASRPVARRIFFLHHIVAPGELLWDDDFAVWVHVELFVAYFVGVVDKGRGGEHERSR